jgi:Ser-Thr-rich glycosyl-phosphatidyl-inositol-anchored membrane family
MRISTALKRALLVAAVPFAAGIPLYALSAASAPPEIAGKPAIPGLRTPAGAMGGSLALLGPGANVQQNPGQTVQIIWTGGNPGWHVNISLADVDAWAVAASVATNITNSTQSIAWTVPASLPCNRRYEFYIAEVTNITWNYGPVFRLKCDVAVIKQHIGSSYVIKLVNGPYPIVPLISPASQQTVSVPIFSIHDNVPGGITVTGGSGTGPGTWSPATVSSTTGPATLALTFRLNTQTTIGAGQPIAQYTLGAVAPLNCASEAMAVSNAVTGGTLTLLADVIPANNTAICVP